MNYLAFKRFSFFVVASLILLINIATAFSQVTTGTIRGIVNDPNNQVVPNAGITIRNNSTNISQNVNSSSEGEFQVSDLLPGDYTVSVQATSFKALTLTNVRVETNQVTNVTANLQLGVATETVEVSAAGAELVETTTSDLSKSFQERQVQELAQTSIGGGVNNLALIAPNVSSSGGVGVGSGGSVGGQRPRNNNFVVDGIDNNDKSVTGPQVYITPEAVKEFTLQANQYSAEFGRSNGGQFITVTKYGTNQFTGSAYGFVQNRSFNALDNLQKTAGITRETQPRFDYGRFGGNIGGPLYLPAFNEGGPHFLGGKDKLFFFTSWERQQTGQAASPGGITSPTAAGLALISSIPGISTRNFGVLTQFLPVAARADQGTIDFCRVARDSNGDCPNNNFVAVPVGSVSFPAPNFSNNTNFILNIDYNQSEKTTHRGRFIFNNNSSIDTAANLPSFFISAPFRNRLFSYTLTHTFTSNFSNETRLAYRYSQSATPVPNSQFPGLDAFPNIGLQDLGVDIGPDPNGPQSTTEHNYQVVNNSTWQLGNHAVKFGADFRNIISPQSFVQRQRGDYQYQNLDTYLFDLSPDFGERTVGSSPYYGNQRLFFPYVQDDWRIRQNLTLNLGLNYSFQSVPRGAKLQALNAISSVPGLIDFRAPKSQKKNFGPKVGFAYSPSRNSGIGKLLFGENNTSSLRAGFSIGYDYIFDNVYILALPPQAAQTVDPDPFTPNFLANGGIPNLPAAGITDPATARAATGSYIPDQQVPYAITYTLSYQRQLYKNYSLELRYLGTRGVHLLTQNRINRQVKVSDTLPGLPTFYSQPSQAQLNGLGLTLNQINARSSYVQSYAQAGFNGSNLVGFLSNGNSSYNGFSTQLIRRFSNGFYATAAYTWSHLIDDTTAEVFSTVLSPRRVEDFQNLRADKADSALDRRQRFVLATNYELPFFKKSNGFARALLGGFEIAGTLTLESGQKATVLSGIDSNLNGDLAGDRTIINPNGVEGTASTVTALRNSAGQVVGYLANNPNAQYIQAGAGTVANAGRNTLQLPGIKNVDLSLFKNFRFGERYNIQLRGDFFNAFNIPQYIPGSPNSINPISTTGVSDVNTVGRNSFNKPDQVFSSNPRVIQLALKFNF